MAHSVAAGDIKETKPIGGDLNSDAATISKGGKSCLCNRLALWKTPHHGRGM